MFEKKFLMPLLCLVVALSLSATATRGANILFVSSMTEVGDDALKAFMEGLGHTVTYIDDDEDEATTEAEAAAADLVFISESCGSGGIKNEITEIEVPIIVGEPWAWDEMGLTEGDGGDDPAVTTDVEIVDPGHYLAAGLSGTVAVLTDILAGCNLGKGITGPEATVIATATLSDGVTYDVIFVYEKGAALPVAPADGSAQVAADIRIGFGFHAACGPVFGDNAYAMLGAAVEYALGQAGPPPEPVNPGNPDLLAWWTCDEGAGTVVGDASGNGHDGTFVNGDPAWVEGIHGNAVELVGPTLVEVPPLDVELTEATMAGWIKPYGAQSDWSSLIMHRVPSLAHGFNILGFQLAYHWNDDSASWSYRGGDMIAEDDWTFAAVTIEPDKATFYVNGVAGSVNEISHGPAMWDGNIYLGGDSRAGSTDRRMNGALDDVSFFSRALTANEILDAMEGVEPVDMEIGFATQPLVIDGEVDGIWADASTQNIVPLDDPANASGSWQVLYDSENLYVMVDMTDDSLQNDSPNSWQDDSVEFYFDGGNTKLSTPLSEDDRQYTFGWTTEDIQGVNTQIEGVEHAQVDTDTGWRIEIKFPWLSLQDTEPQARDLIGIDVYYNDDDDGGDSRENKLLTFSTEEFWNDASGWGTAMLIADKRVDVTAPGDAIQGVPNDGLMDGDNFGWPPNETPDLAIDDDITKKYLHFKGEIETTGFQVTPLDGPTIVTGLTFTTANDAEPRDPVVFELSGSNESIDGPYELIASGDIVDFAQADAWPRFTMNATPISFNNDVAYAHYQVLFPAVRDAASANSMQIAEVELLGVPAPAGPVPVGYWMLDDGEGTIAVDSSGNGNDGTIVGNPTWIDGVEGTALEFHGLGAPGGGGDYIDCGNDASLDITGPISIALWIRPGADDPEGQATTTAPMAKAMSGMSPSWSYQVRYGWGGAPQPYMAFTFNTSPRAWAFVGRNLERDEWCHIACSHDGTTLKCYLNGEETDSTPMGQITSSPTPVLIGSDGWGCDWIGAIDEVAIYDQALSADEISELAGVSDAVENLLANPSFEEDEPILDDPDWVNWCTWNPAEGAGSNATIVDTEAIDGARSLRIEPKGLENWHFIVLYLSFPADLDKNYTTNFWAKAEAPRPLTVQMKAADNSVNAWGATDFELTTEWAEYTYTSEVLHTDVKLEICCSGTEVPFWLDLVSVCEAD